MDGTPEIKFWMKFRMKSGMTGFETFAFFAWFFQYLYNSRQWGEIKSGYGTSPGGVFEFASGVLDSNRTSKFDDALGSGGKRLRNPF